MKHRHIAGTKQHSKGEGRGQHIKEGQRLIGYVASARVPMPKSTAIYLENLSEWKATMESDLDDL